jgi:DNA-binding CsgD family transcriptional regulator
MSSIFGIDAGITLITWERLDRPGPGRGDLSFIGGWGLTRQQIADATATGPRHPSYQALWQTGTAYPVRTSDHVVLREFWPTDVWRVQHSPSNGRYPIGFAVSSSPTELKFIGMHRSDHDFSDEELSALAAIQTLLVPALQFRSGLDLAASRLLSSAELDGVGEDYRPSQREAEVLALVTLGWTNDRIGRRLGITERTVRKHLEAVYVKAGISGRAAAAAWWQASHVQARGFPEPPDDAVARQPKPRGIPRRLRSAPADARPPPYPGTSESNLH